MGCGIRKGESKKMGGETKNVDGCYERFGTDETKCEAAAPRCQWYGEKGGEGKCGLRNVEMKKMDGEMKNVDGCYERFGIDETKCEAAAARCRWYGKKGGEGKCALREDQIGADTAMGAAADGSSQAESNSEGETSVGWLPSSVPVTALVTIVVALVVVAGTGGVCFVRRRRAQRGPEQVLASNADQLPAEGNEAEIS